MTDSTHTVRAPQCALAWTAVDGWLYEHEVAPSATDMGDLVLVVSEDGYLRGVTIHDRVPLVAVLRIDGDLTEIVARIDQLADRVAGLDTGLAVEVGGRGVHVEGPSASAGEQTRDVSGSSAA